jgi:hypothetical protein
MRPGAGTRKEKGGRQTSGMKSREQQEIKFEVRFFAGSDYSGGVVQRFPKAA